MARLNRAGRPGGGVDAAPETAMEFGEIRHQCVLMKTSGDGGAQPVGSDTLVLK